MNAVSSLRKSIRVLIVDDSAVVRSILSRDLSAVPGIEVVGAAPDPYVARDMVIKLQPDVLTLDVEMPRMDGITFLGLLMKHRPTPVIVVSSLTPRGSKTAVAAMEAGAIDVVCKPDGSFSVGDLSRELVGRIRIAAMAKLRTPVEPGRVLTAMAETTDRILAIGASTGGVQALTAVISRLPANAPGTVIVQHMPPSFTGSFARRLDSLSQVSVCEAKGGESILSGQVLIAPGGHHMVVRRSGARYFVDLRDGPAEHHQRPAVDVLFRSVAEHVGANAVGAILTGMGTDGAQGLLAMHKAGARTVAQDEATSVVYGMSAAAVNAGAVDEILPLDAIAPALVRLATTRRAA